MTAPKVYDYPPRVRFEVAEQEIDSYRRAAEFLIDNVEVVSVQHEFGIYGGAASWSFSAKCECPWSHVPGIRLARSE